MTVTYNGVKFETIGTKEETENSWTNEIVYSQNAIDEDGEECVLTFDVNENVIDVEYF